VTTELDVVIPALNEASSLGPTIEALRALEHHLIVCDGGSRDDTQAIARRAGATVVVSEAGRGRQLAAGAAAGEAPWLLFLHADSILSPDWTESVRHFVSDTDNRERAAYFRLGLASPDPRARRIERLVAWRCRTFGLPYGDQGLLLARTFYRRLGGFRSLPLMEDVDLVRRIGRRNLLMLEARAVTSARRYERDGWLRRPLRNLSCLTLYFAGVPAPVLQRLYR
jgi:rSAM/selenodomain-associated transferase 2